MTIISPRVQDFILFLIFNFLLLRARTHGGGQRKRESWAEFPPSSEPDGGLDLATLRANQESDAELAEPPRCPIKVQEFFNTFFGEGSGPRVRGDPLCRWAANAGGPGSWHLPGCFGCLA